MFDDWYSYLKENSNNNDNDKITIGQTVKINANFIIAVDFSSFEFIKLSNISKKRQITYTFRDMNYPDVKPNMTLQLTKHHKSWSVSNILSNCTNLMIINDDTQTVAWVGDINKINPNFISIAYDHINNIFLLDIPLDDSPFKMTIGNKDDIIIPIDKCSDNQVIVMINLDVACCERQYACIPIHTHTHKHKHKQCPTKTTLSVSDECQMNWRKC